MAKRQQLKNPEQLRKELLSLIQGFEDKLKENNLREQVISLIPAHNILADLGCSLMNEDGVESARARILAYMTRFPQTLIHGDELKVVAGISEYARPR